MVQPVKYDELVESKNLFEFKEDALKHWVFTKSHVWDYEEEIRAFCLEKNESIKFDKACLKEVIFGCNTTIPDRESMIQLIKHSNYGSIKFKEIIIDDKTFNIKAIEFNRT